MTSPLLPPDQVRRAYLEELGPGQRAAFSYFAALPVLRRLRRERQRPGR